MEEYEIVYGEETVEGGYTRQLIIVAPKAHESENPVKALGRGYVKGLMVGLKWLAIGLGVLILAAIVMGI